MSTVKVFPKNEKGCVKPMNCVNSGPVPERKTEHNENKSDGASLYKTLEIPITRNHDVAFVIGYGAPHVVDVHLIFPDFDADENDPANYDFYYTDRYTEGCKEAGSQTFYRLGPSIEHGAKKYGTIPPKDFKKWARICEHIIAHLNYGWAEGLHLDIKYWEIWFEPDLDKDDAKTKRAWGGTKAQYFDLYETASKHLKAKFPELLIGGPALAFDVDEWTDDFLSYVKKTNSPLDFFSWHAYKGDPNIISEMADKLRTKLNKNGFEKALSICNEYNYVKGWEGDEYKHSQKSIISDTGASYVGAVMALSHDRMDQLYYYDVRPGCMWNGIYNLYFEKLPTYAVFAMFRNLRRLGTNIETVCTDKDLYAISAKGEKGVGTMISYFTNSAEAAAKTITVEYNDFEGNIVPYIIGEDNDIKALDFSAKGNNLTFKIKPNSVMYIEAN